MKSGFVSIIGRPNAGKSTLLNSLLSDKLAITSPKAQTTRNSITGILNEKDYQIVFVDTPGVHTPKTSLGVYMNKEALNQVEGADVIYYLVDGKTGIRNEDKDILDRLFKSYSNIFLLINKIDEINKDKLIERLSYASRIYKFAEIIPISALNKDNLDELLKTTISYLKDNVRYYPEDINNTSSKEFKIVETIREKILLNLDEEVPHLCAVKIINIEEKENRIDIAADIIVNKDSHKAILIGKKGSMLKKINTSSIISLKKLFNKKVNLSTFVKVDEDWINSDKKLFELGYFIEK